MSDSNASSANRAAGEPLYIVEPREPHTHTFVLLHGLGSNGEKFGTELLDTGLTSFGHKLTALFPGARFVFPTSKRRRSTAFGRSMLTQWFDIVRIEEPSYRKERQLDGLSESAREIREIIATELQKVKPQNLIIGGLSQGCAMSLAVLLSLEHPVGGYIGMSGFLTYQSDLETAVKDEDDDDNPFEDSDEAEEQTSTVKAQAMQRDILGLELLDHPSHDATAFTTPVFLGHGEVDEKVPLALGEGAAQLMRDAGYQVDWKCYQNQGHWYKIPDEIDDVCNFIASKVGWEITKPVASAT
ncbi:acyl- thioesterase [Fusarium albosuccineum]|uniref:Acyl- thioesterase n=1 Tax=Fusarium albosuccineum TaxID=1237068 RepID=A0A8H4L1U4_9HYPO|nr:acyl- thioesterase [Fusarium albosuccineum]